MNGPYTDDEARWRAVETRDRGADGSFFIAVKTTGIYCRPGCHSRTPRRENVRYFDTGDEARKAGFRPCKRCRPDEPSRRDDAVKRVIAACRRIEDSDPPPSLSELAEEAGLSPWHFQRVFTGMVGVSPKRYASTHKARRFREGLDGGGSVTAAIYDAGYGSSGRAYDPAGDRLAMTPTAYKKGGMGMTIRYAIAESALGPVIVGATERGVCFIGFEDDPGLLPGRLKERYPAAQVTEATGDLAETIQRVVEMTDHPGLAADLPLDIRGTAFQERVWASLREIPAGETRTYAQVAVAIGRPKAVRAVAGACGANKVAVAIPCHRVVRSDGGLGGYRWGVERKKTLLRREGDAAGKPET